MIRRKIFIWLLLLIFGNKLFYGQKVGLVLSGGGSSGIAHVGVLKALEENNIPIDYIAGTSVGALIGAYYACGYTPNEIDALVKSSVFKQISLGELPTRYMFLLKKRNEYASWINFKLSLNNKLINNLPTNVINSIPIDYYLMETFSGANAIAGRNFDSLLVPFRCVASDVEANKTVVFKEGDLSQSIRGSMSYPFYIRPISINGRLLFDGGLYDNFPTDVMYNEFFPDFIIGSDVTEADSILEDDNLYMQVRHLMISQNNFNPVCENGILIKPWSRVNTFNFDEIPRLIDSGYAATLRIIPALKKQIARQADNELLNKKREHFKIGLNTDSVVFNKVEISGVNDNTSKFIRKSLFFKNKPFTLTELKRRYFRLTSDDKIKSIYPIAERNPSTGFFKLNLQAKKEKNLYLDIGGNISNRPISETFLGIQYNHLGRIGFTAYINGYYGKLHISTHSKIRLDFPGKVPFYIEPTFTYSRWDFYSSSVLFYDFQKPAYLLQEDMFGEFNVGFPLGNKSTFIASGGISEWGNRYYQTDNFTKLDTADATYFDFAFGQIAYEMNTLNRKQYATSGTKIQFKAKYVSGSESYYPGTTSIDSLKSINYPYHDWLTLKLTFDSYIRTFKWFRLGAFAEGVYSTQTFFKNYTSTILSAPAFNPTIESQTLFIPAYRAHSYLAGGLKAITTPFKNFDFRLEGYLFQPVNTILSTATQDAKYSEPFLYRNFIGTATLVYNTPVGPISLGVNYYDKNENSFSFFFHVGYVIFNKKSLD